MMNYDLPSPTIIMITHVVPFSPAAGNEIRILKMLQWLKKEGYRTILLLNHASLDPNVLKALKEIVDAVHLIDVDESEVDLEVLSSHDYNYSAFFYSFIKRIMNGLKVSFAKLFMKKALQHEIESKLAKKSLSPDKLMYMTHQLCIKYKPLAVIAEYIFTTPCLDVVPSGVLKIVDTHDMFSRRNQEELLYCTPREERNYLLKSDVVIAIQPEEERMFQKLVPEREILTIGIDYEVITEIDNRLVVPGTILFVGSDNALNIAGLKDFYNNAWPVIRDKNPDAVLRIVGKIGNHFQSDDERMQIVGWVEDLDDEYKKANVLINPTVAGTGLKIKSIEALCNAKPLVATPNSVEGLLITDDPPFIVCHNWPAFANAVLMLLESKSKRIDLQSRALQFARLNFSSEKNYTPLSERLRQCCMKE